MQSLTDEELMTRLKSGEPQAFEILFLRHKNKVYGYLLKHSGDRNLAEDLLQEVFEKVYVKSHSFKEKMLFLPWIFTISKNAMIDAFRKNGREKEFVKSFEITASEAARTSEFHFDIGSLPLRYQEALKLRYFEDRDFEEISKQMNISLSNARKLISRALGLLKAKGGKK